VIDTVHNEGTSTAFDIEARQFWALGARGTILAGLEATGQNDEVTVRNAAGMSFDSDTDSNVVRLSVGLGYNFFDRSGPADQARNRVELGFTTSRRTTDFTDGTNTLNERSIAAGYVFRKPFGSIRVRFEYAID